MLKQQITQYLKDLANQTDQTKNKDFFKNYLKTMQKFHEYSIQNQLLIHQQFPEANKIAGFQTWKKLNRKIKKNQKAIKILAPIKIEKNKEEETIYFKPVNVFDISQTTGKPLPNINIENKGNHHKNTLNKLIKLCKNKNIKLEFKELPKNLYGYNQKRNIVINSKKNPNTQVTTLIHEIAHEILHQNKEKLTKQQKEIQAEATSHIITKILGIKSKSFNYLALWDADYKKIMNNLESINKGVNEIMKEIKSS